MHVLRVRVVRESKAERDKFYGSKPWRAVRASHLAEFPLCAECEKAGKLTPADTVHHKVERLIAPDLALDTDNLESSCSPCHTRRHKMQKEPK